MVDNHAARNPDQPPVMGGKRGWISKAVLFVIFVGISTILVLLA